MVNPMNELTKDFSAEELREVERGTQLLRLEHELFSQLAALRGRELNDEEMAAIDAVQEAMSKLDRPDKLLLPTLNQYVKVLGGTLEIHAVFPEGAVTLNVDQDRAQAQRALLAQDFERFTIQLFLDEDNNWMAFFVELPEVSTFGETTEDALKELRAAWALVQASYRDENESIDTFLFKQMLNRVHERNAHLSPEEVEALVQEAIAETRKKRRSL
jgi:predicted RNase H-like HicB family nuclease